MRSLLLFIGSLLYPTVMVVISPLLAVLYLFFGLVLLGHYLQSRIPRLLQLVAAFKLHPFHFSYKKQLVFRPKAVRLH